MKQVRSSISHKGYGEALLAIVLVLGMNCAATASSNPNRDEAINNARALLREGKSQEAFDLLSPHELQWSGGDAYDYLLGVAALDSDNVGEAIFSLQRLVARNPYFSGARLELARAYYDVGDIELARTEFQRLLLDNPPDRVRATIAGYLNAIDTRAQSYTTSVQYFIDLGVGYDSNATGATDENQFLVFTLSPNNLEQSSAFGQVTIGGMWSKPLGPESQLMIQGSVMHRSNPSTHFVDPSNTSLGATWAWNRGSHKFNLGATAVASNLDRDSNKKDYAINGSYLFKISDAWRLSSFARYGTSRYEQPLEIQDVDQLMFGLGLEQMSEDSLFSVTLLNTKDDERETGSRFGNDGIGLQISNTWYSGKGTQTFMSLSASATEFDEQFYALDREDDTWAVSVGRTWPQVLGEGWDITLRLNYTGKKSTVDLYEYDRWEAGVFLRRTFN